MDCLIRKVQQGDEFDLAYIQTESWKAAFKDIPVCRDTANVHQPKSCYGNV